MAMKNPQYFPDKDNPFPTNPFLVGAWMGEKKDGHKEVFTRQKALRTPLCGIQLPE